MIFYDEVIQKAVSAERKPTQPAKGIQFSQSMPWEKQLSKLTDLPSTSRLASRRVCLLQEAKLLLLILASKGKGRSCEGSSAVGGRHPREALTFLSFLWSRGLDDACSFFWLPGSFSPPSNGAVRTS